MRHSEFPQDERSSARRRGAGPVEASLPQLRRHVAENLARRIFVDELAALSGLTISQLSRSVRRQCDTTPYAFVLAERIEHAKALLQSGMNIADAAYMSGFADQSHFTRHFRRVTGMTPGVFAQARN
jgi:AraC-like DNA-binding protein